MRAAFIRQTGPPDVINVGELPDPTPTGDEVLVEVKAASVNPIDTYIRGGLTGGNLPFPYVLGCDFAGVVRAAGSHAAPFKPGMRVWGASQGIADRQGTFAELTVVDRRWLFPTPDGVSDETVAAASLVAITAGLGLLEEAKLAAGETLLVHGASGAVGTAIIQIGKALGARVIAATSGAEKLSYVRHLGADETIDYQAGDLAADVKRLAPGGVDVWWETSAHMDLDVAVGALARRGRVVLMAGRNARPILPVGPLYTRSARICGFTIFDATPEAQRRVADRIGPWLVGGVLTTSIDRVGRLEDAAEFHRLQEESTQRGTTALRGKLVVKP
jgi:NADPH2:quinone reductase